MTPSDQDTPSAIAARIAEVLSMAMNLWPLLKDPQSLFQHIDAAQLRDALLFLSAELLWLYPISQRYPLQGFTLPQDIPVHAEQLAKAAQDWTPASPPPEHLMECARLALRGFFEEPKD